MKYKMSYIYIAIFIKKFSVKAIEKFSLYYTLYAYIISLSSTTVMDGSAICNNLVL